MVRKKSGNGETLKICSPSEMRWDDVARSFWVGEIKQFFSSSLHFTISLRFGATFQFSSSSSSPLLKSHEEAANYLPVAARLSQSRQLNPSTQPVNKCSRLTRVKWENFQISLCRLFSLSVTNVFFCVLLLCRAASLKLIKSQVNWEWRRNTKRQHSRQGQRKKRMKNQEWRGEKKYL